MYALEPQKLSLAAAISAAVYKCVKVYVYEPPITGAKAVTFKDGKVEVRQPFKILIVKVNVLTKD